jgi:hypothetical protein
MKFLTNQLSELKVINNVIFFEQINSYKQFGTC